MPDTPPPTARPDPSAETTEFTFDKPVSESPRIKRRSLKTKSTGLKPATPPVTARDLENEAPPLTAEAAAKPARTAPASQETSQARTQPARTTPVAPPRVKPSGSGGPTTSGATTSSTVASAAYPAPKPANVNGVTPAATGQKVDIVLTAQQKATAAVLAASTPVSPHGTRPATLYYTSQSKKEASDSMKTTPTASSAASTTASSSATRPATAASATTSASRPASATTASTSATRPAVTVNTTAAPRAAATNFDYRANVERQSREQKSVGSILGYFVYGLIAVFLVGAGLATYGSVIIFDKLHDQSTNISSLDDKYGQKVADLNKELITQGDALNQSNATVARQQDLLAKQEEEISQLRAAIAAASSASGDAIHAEARARAQENATLRARLRDLESRTSMETLSHP